MSMHHNKWTPEQDAQLHALVMQGLSFPEIGLRLGVSRLSIKARVRRLGIKRPEKRAMRHAFAERLAEHGDIALAAQEIGTTRSQGHNLMLELRRDLGWQAR